MEIEALDDRQNLDDDRRRKREMEIEAWASQTLVRHVRGWKLGWQLDYHPVCFNNRDLFGGLVMKHTVDLSSQRQQLECVAEDIVASSLRGNLRTVHFKISGGSADELQAATWLVHALSSTLVGSVSIERLTIECSNMKAERTNAECTNAERTNAERTNAERTNAERTNAERTNAECANAECANAECANAECANAIIDVILALFSKTRNLRLAGVCLSRQLLWTLARVECLCTLELDVARFSTDDSSLSADSSMSISYFNALDRRLKYDQDGDPATAIRECGPRPAMPHFAPRAKSLHLRFGALRADSLVRNGVCMHIVDVLTTDGVLEELVIDDLDADAVAGVMCLSPRASIRALTVNSTYATSDRTGALLARCLPNLERLDIDKLHVGEMMAAALEAAPRLTSITCNQLSPDMSKRIVHKVTPNVCNSFMGVQRVLDSVDNGVRYRGNMVVATVEELALLASTDWHDDDCTRGVDAAAMRVILGITFDHVKNGLLAEGLEKMYWHRVKCPVVQHAAFLAGAFPTSTLTSAKQVWTLLDVFPRLETLEITDDALTDDMAHSLLPLCSSLVELKLASKRLTHSGILVFLCGVQRMREHRRGTKFVLRWKCSLEDFCRVPLLGGERPVKDDKPRHVSSRVEFRMW